MRQKGFTVRAMRLRGSLLKEFISIYQFYLSDLPGLVKVGLQRAVETQVREPPLAGYILDPVALLFFKSSIHTFS